MLLLKPLTALARDSLYHLLLRQRAAREDGLEVHPLALHGVEVERAVRERGEARLPQRGALAEGREEGRLLQRGDQTLMVAHLREQVLPLLDQVQGALARRAVLMKTSGGMI
eukprot:773800-Pyramimonas_sp.AAC.1